MLLNVSWWSIESEGTLCHSREDFNHWVTSFLLILLRMSQDIKTKWWKFSPKKNVYKIDLSQNICQVHDFTGDKLSKIVVILSHGWHDVWCQERNLFLLCIGSHDGRWQILSQVLNSSRFPSLPNVSGQIKANSLKEQCKTYPLVIFMVNTSSFRSILFNTRMSNLWTDFLWDWIWQSKRWLDPTIGVNNLLH